MYYIVIIIVWATVHLKAQQTIVLHFKRAVPSSLSINFENADNYSYDKIYISKNHCFILQKI